MVQAIPKSERSELAIDLATQAGADEFIAWQADRCIAKWDGKKAPKALAKWQSQAHAAAKQSRRTRVPFAHGPLTTPQLVKHLAERDNALVYVLHEDATESIKLGPEVLRTASAAMVALAAIGVRTSRW